jgi:beta-galactosidase
MKEWKDSETDRSVSSFKLSDLPDGTKELIIIHTLLNDRVKWINRIIVTGDGTLEVNADINAEESLPVIPKIGMTAQIPASYKNITWFGKGPQENYIDRQTAAEVGLYAMDINNFITPYIKPQENANRTGIRWMSFSGADGSGVMVEGVDLLSMSAWPWTADQLEIANHTNELPVNDFITINIDLRQMGVGGNDSWSQRAFPLNQYQIISGNYSYSFLLKPLSGR